MWKICTGNPEIRDGEKDQSAAWIAAINVTHLRSSGWTVFGLPLLSDELIDGSSGKEAAEQPAKRVRKERHCRRCGKTGHNARTYAAKTVEFNKAGISK